MKILTYEEFKEDAIKFNSQGGRWETEIRVLNGHECLYVKIGKFWTYHDDLQTAYEDYIKHAKDTELFIEKWERLHNEKVSSISSNVQ